MPFLLSPERWSRPRWRRAVGVLAGAVALLSAIPAVADACTVPSTSGSAVFAPFGDSSSYVLAPGGSFESGTSGWSLFGVSIQSGNESYHVHAASDSHSLWISPGGTAISAPICINITDPTFRFFARETTGSWAEMNINVLWTDALGVSHVTTAGGLSLSPSAGWTLSKALPLAQMLGSLQQAGSTLSVRLQFVPMPSGGGVAIDDVYVDPYSRS